MGAGGDGQKAARPSRPQAFSLGTIRVWSMHMAVLRMRSRKVLARRAGLGTEVMAEPVTKYVGYKVSKVRWKPQPAGSIEGSDTFASGSWDDEVGGTNWKHHESPP